MLELILGGARSGKSRLAEKTAADLNQPVVYIATAQALDPEMQDRILHHQQRRPTTWHSVEAPLYLADVLMQYDQVGRVILVDCLTLWMSNLLLQDDQALQAHECKKLLQILPTLQSHVILVSNETGLGVVPRGQLTRQFVDESGRLHQNIGQVADRVRFCVAGFAMLLKGENA